MGTVTTLNNRKNQELSRLLSTINHPGISHINHLDLNGYTVEIILIDNTSIIVCDEYTTPRTYGATAARTTRRGQTPQTLKRIILTHAEHALTAHQNTTIAA